MHPVQLEAKIHVHGRQTVWPRQPSVYCRAAWVNFFHDTPTDPLAALTTDQSVQSFQLLNSNVPIGAEPAPHTEVPLCRAAWRSSGGTEACRPLQWPWLVSCWGSGELACARGGGGLLSVYFFFRERRLWQCH